MILLMRTMLHKILNLVLDKPSYIHYYNLYILVDNNKSIIYITII
jgi:hypothetical protein